MKLLHLSSFVRKKRIHRKPKEDKDTSKTILFPNIPKRKWREFNKNELWVTDVSLIPYGIKNRWAYLSVIKDVATGMIVGSSIQQHPGVKLFRDTLKEANEFRDKSEN
ncbi:DDE-type integrase/transposase/recombinase [Mesoplasma seiffertii]|uniref:DDE-type integrase/transposase/recombinase n=1 Tax=Mesoplasma seiffertii TaxID=28224 RepID=UPI0012EB1789|nr:DDE-type integrase/transposase/recombinase [Mesoplasma seiffertii]